MPRAVLLASAVAVLVAAGCGGGPVSSNRIPAATMTAMGDADRYELLSLDPARAPTPPPDAFHGWRVLGRTTVPGRAARERLNDALRAGVEGNSTTAAGCFIPRHGIRVVRAGEVYDLVICFECLQVKVFEPEAGARWFLVSESPQPAFDEALRAAGVPLAAESD